jgi:hypothetical protein
VPLLATAVEIRYTTAEPKKLNAHFVEEQLQRTLKGIPHRIGPGLLRVVDIVVLPSLGWIGLKNLAFLRDAWLVGHTVALSEWRSR